MEKYLKELEEYFYTCECFGDDVLAIRKDHLKQSLESVELDTARKIGEAAGQAGLVPEDLANPEDWKNALQTLEKEVRKDEREKVLEEVLEWIEILPKTKHAPDFKDEYCISIPVIKSKLKQLNK